jgi:hypothetical protein
METGVGVVVVVAEAEAEPEAEAEAGDGTESKVGGDNAGTIESSLCTNAASSS